MIYLGQAYRAGGGTVCGTMLKYMGGLRATQHTAWTREVCARAEEMIG